MFKSKSDRLGSLVALLALMGCDSMRTPEPVSNPGSLRPSLSGFVVGESNFNVDFARPVDDPYEKSVFLPWIDESSSNLMYTRRGYTSGSGNYVPSFPVVSRIFNGSRMTGSVNVPGSSYLETLRIRGALVWNASAPYSISAGFGQRDSFDLAPQPGERRRFLRNAVRAEIALRWPKLALSDRDSLIIWSSRPESVQVFLDDWKRLCQGRGLASARLLYSDPSRHPTVFEWVEPDSSKIRWIMNYNDLAQVVFSAGDSVWMPSRISCFLVARLDSVPSVPVASNFETASIKYGFAFLVPYQTETMIRSMNDDLLYFDLARNSWYPPTTTTPYRITVQATPTCAAYKEWIFYGPSDRDHKSHGNVAPFDGYYCKLFPDTMSFPRGDVVLMPPDTSSKPKTLTVKDTAIKSVLKATP